jgi:hypothetical protein
VIYLLDRKAPLAAKHNNVFGASKRRANAASASPPPTRPLCCRPTGGNFPQFKTTANSLKSPHTKQTKKYIEQRVENFGRYVENKIYEEKKI